VLWGHRRLLARVVCIALPVALAIAFLIPKQYKSAARIMPPDQQGSSAMMLAALASRTGGLGSLGALAGGLLGGHTTTALFIDLLRSGTVAGHIIDRFDLQTVYGKRYRIDTAKRLTRLTTITDDKKSGVITIEVLDTDPARARNIAQAYLDELNKLVTATSTSAAHRERVFIENRLQSVQGYLEDAQLKLGEFSSRNSTVDIKEQTRAIVDVGARVQGELLVQQASLESLRQVYGDGNIRVHQSEARIATLQHQLKSMAGTSTPLSSSPGEGTSENAATPSELSPPLRQLPRLAVPYADLYRRVKVQETVFELLTQQFELARIEEAKDIPVVSVIDAPGIAEKKSFPPRLWIALALTAGSLIVTAVLVLIADAWGITHPDNAFKALVKEISSDVRSSIPSLLRLRRSAS
jgi:capsule polysaccharide export protein KpsE/RkpR